MARLHPPFTPECHDALSPGQILMARHGVEGRLANLSEREDKGSRFILELPGMPEVGMPAAPPSSRGEAWSPSP